MKQIVLIICFFFSAWSSADAQLIDNVSREVKIKVIGYDSVAIPLNENFELIEDSCSQIIRYGHLNFDTHKFKGKVIDVSRTDPNLALTEGYYSSQGLKEGKFIARFLNGKLQASGNFKNDVFDGKWEVFYDDGHPHITFESTPGDVKIIDMWDNKSTKVIDNGKGNYEISLGDLYWSGKLLDGKPTGQWKMMRTDDKAKRVVATENFKNGSFQKGTGILGSYDNSSKIVLIAADLLPFINAELLMLSSAPCYGVKKKHIVNAQYEDRYSSFTAQIARATTGVLSYADYSANNITSLVLRGEFSNKGNISHLTADTYGANPAVMKLLKELMRIPKLQPATVDGVPVAQKFVITYEISVGSYSFNYKFLPIETE